MINEKCKKCILRELCPNNPDGDLKPLWLITCVTGLVCWFAIPSGFPSWAVAISGVILAFTIAGWLILFLRPCDYFRQKKDIVTRSRQVDQETTTQIWGIVIGVALVCTILTSAVGYVFLRTWFESPESLFINALAENWEWYAAGLMGFWFFYALGRYLFEKNGKQDKMAYDHLRQGFTFGALCFVGLLGTSEVMEYFSRKVPFGAQNQIALVGSGTVKNYLLSKEVEFGKRISVGRGSNIILWYFEGTSSSGLDVLTAAYDHGRDKEHFEHLPVVGLASREIDDENDFATDTPGVWFFHAVLKDASKVPVWWVYKKKGCSDNGSSELTSECKIVGEQKKNESPIQHLKRISPQREKCKGFLHEEKSGTLKAIKNASAMVCKKHIDRIINDNSLEWIRKNVSDSKTAFWEAICGDKNSVGPCPCVNNEHLIFRSGIDSSVDEKGVEELARSIIDSAWNELKKKSDKKDFSLDLERLEDHQFAYGSFFRHGKKIINPDDEKYEKIKKCFVFKKIYCGDNSERFVTRPMKIAGRILPDAASSETGKNDNSKKDETEYNHTLGKATCKLLNYLRRKKVFSIDGCGWSPEGEKPVFGLDLSHPECRINPHFFEKKRKNCPIKTYLANPKKSQEN